jgi:hypothetical protein
MLYENVPVLIITNMAPVSFFILFRHHNKKYGYIIRYSFFITRRLTELSSGIWLVYTHLYSSASNPTLSIVYILEYTG